MMIIKLYRKTVTELKQEKERKLQRATELVIVHYDHKEIEELKGRRKELDTHEFQVKTNVHIICSIMYFPIKGL